MCLELYGILGDALGALGPVLDPHPAKENTSQSYLVTGQGRVQLA